MDALTVCETGSDGAPAAPAVSSGKAFKTLGVSVTSVIEATLHDYNGIVEATTCTLLPIPFQRVPDMNLRRRTRTEGIGDERIGFNSLIRPLLHVHSDSAPTSKH